MNDASKPSQPKPESTASQVLFILMVSPIMLLLGFHIVGLAMLGRKYLRIPYILGVAILMAAVSTLLLLQRTPDTPIWMPVAAMLFVQLLVIGAHLLNCSKEDLLEGGNCEHIVPAHMMLCLMFLMLPSLYMARDNAIQQSQTTQHEPSAPLKNHACHL